MNSKCPLYINGQFIETAEKQNIINPSTGKVIAEASLASDKEVDLALASAREAFDRGPWPQFSLIERKNFIFRIAQGILDNAGMLAELEMQNTGKPIKETTFMDIPSCAKTFEFIANNFIDYLSQEEVNVSSDAKGKIIREPMGVVVLIVPWNYPLLMACWKMASALAAGNTVILKPSSLTPLSALELAKIIHAAGLPPGVVNVINGSGVKIGQALCEDKRADMISFTGSSEIGKQILTYASKNVKKMIMELGGKSASLIFNDVDLDVAVNSSLTSIFLNQGQMCTAMSRIFVQEAIYDSFLDSFVQKAKRIKLGLADNPETQMGPLISDAQRKKVIAYIDKAKAEGAKVICGGKIPENPELKNGYFFEPTVLVDVGVHSHIFKEEVFGPVVLIHKFSGSDEAASLANSVDFGLAACIWSKDLYLAQELAGNLNAGTVWINTYGAFYNELPYGGFKQSGFGKELGRQGFLEYSRVKSVIIDQSAENKPLVNYWYGF
ncbi:MAG TPA: aldehyde dehydrogenase family protein [Candidatus Omnitrophota bacterium]|nr:aldehyde dehydrogenase family protein [Candidatus Omnitrophota bacterium]HPT38798.1 aldehyde dehydrogenase family protein [Candidatus Omnitrophota bacterium]